MPKTEGSTAFFSSRIVQLVVLAGLSTICYAYVLSISRTFDVGTPREGRMTLAVLAALWVAFVLYWLAIYVATRAPASRLLLGIIIGGASLFRVVLLPSTPIHEIDIYRYLWDGAVVAEGISPYRYAPEQVLEASELPSDQLDSELVKLVELRYQSESLGESLERIHYGYLPSPYPPVSQSVFALSAILTPDAASLRARMVTMKGLLVLFDMATLLVVIALLKEVGMHPGWSVAYGWCPLLMKEFANGGHLDSIAIFLTTATVWLLVRTNLSQARPSMSGTILVGSALALAIGAKLYPVVLVPLIVCVWWKQGGLRISVAGIMASVVLTMAVLSPMLVSSGSSRDSVTTVEQASVPPSSGVREFLSEWEMNDLLFMIVRENLRPQVDKPLYEQSWFVIVPDNWSRDALAWAGADSTEEVKQVSFLLARILTGGVFFILALWLAWRAAEQSEVFGWCRAAMLTLAWFWFLCPTQNPWYWCWVLPLLPFARYRTWYTVGAFALLYYARFWLTSHYSSPPVLGTEYDGANYFDAVVVWIELAPCLVALAAEWWLGRSSDWRPVTASTVSEAG